MLEFFGYNFLSDGNAIDPFPSSMENIGEATLENAIYDEFFITKDVESQYSTTKPTDWDIYTIVLALFQGNLDGGNIGGSIDQLDSIRIKRRKVGSFEWITIKEIPVNTVDDINFANEDLLAMNGERYEYAWIPVLNGIEGNYITAEIDSKFNGVFIADADTIYKFYSGVSYGSLQQNQQVGVFTLLNQQYPIYVANGQSNYQTGSFSGRTLGNFEDTRELNRKEMVEQRDNLLKFLTNKKAKIIKDYNGNQWLVFITGSPNVEFDNKWGNGLMTVNFQWSEVGNPENEQDLQNTGLAPII